MRTFYIFKINKDIYNLTIDSPYNLFHTIERLYYMDYSNIELASFIFDNLNKENINNSIRLYLEKDRFYKYSDNAHIVNNKYREENTYIKVYNTYILVNTNREDIYELIYYLDDLYLFTCDFQNKDYFWVSKFVR